MVMERQIEAALKIMCLIHEENILIMSLLLSPKARDKVLQAYADKYNAIVDEFYEGEMTEK